MKLVVVSIDSEVYLTTTYSRLERVRHQLEKLVVRALPGKQMPRSIQSNHDAVPIVIFVKATISAYFVSKKDPTQPFLPQANGLCSRKSCVWRRQPVAAGTKKES